MREIITRLTDLWRSLGYALATIKAGLVLLAGKLRQGWYLAEGRWPPLGALRRRYQNHSAIFHDLTVVFVIGYIVLGVVGYVGIYPQKRETRFVEKVSAFYPFPAVRVDTSISWTQRFFERLRFLKTFSERAPENVVSRPPSDAELRQRVLEGLVEDKIIFHEAKKRGLRVSKEEVDATLATQGDPKEVAAQIKSLYGMNMAQFRQKLAEQALKEKVKDAVLGKIRVSHIFTLDRPSAEEAKRQIEGGLDFAEAAKVFSQDAKTAESGGDLGYWRTGELANRIDPAVEEALINLAVGGLAGPVQTKFGFHLLKVTEKYGELGQTYEQWYAATVKNYTVKKYIRI